MPDPRSRHGATALAVAILLSVLTGFGGIVAAVCGWLAQPAAALAVRWMRTDDGGRPAGITLRHDLPALATLWALALVIAAVAAAWPLESLRARPTLGATLGLSAVCGLLLIGLWRVWPLWHALETEGGSLLAHWRRAGERDGATWRGLATAGAIASVVALVLLAAWPGLLSPAARWVIATVAAVAWPVAHLLLQRATVPHARALPIVDMRTAVPAVPPVDEPTEPAAALYAAARAGRVDHALALLAAGADPAALPPAGSRDQRALPVLAAVLPDLRLLRALIGQGIDVNAAHAGMTPLLAATRDSWHGRPDAVMTLLANGADPRAADQDGNTPLHHAARSSDPGVAALLRDAAAELDVRNLEGVTPLGIACASANWRLARFLLERGARPEPESGTPALLPAAGGEEDDPAGVQLLLKHKARVDARDARARTALHEAAFVGHAEIIATLLAAHADVQARDAALRTPLLEAARGARAAAFEVLAPLSDLAARDREGRNAIALACLADSPTPELLDRMLELGVVADAADADGRRPIEHAAAAGRWSLVRALDPAYPLPGNVADADGGLPASDLPPLVLLAAQLRDGRFDGLEPLLPLLSPAELGALLIDDDGTTPSAERVDWLLEQGADSEVRAEGADAAMFRLLAMGPPALPALRVLLRRGVSPAGRGGLARFLEACARDEQAGRALEQFAIELLERGADPFAPALSGEPALSLAVRLGWMRMLDALLVLGVDPDARDVHGMTALHLCAALGREAPLKTLVAQGASPDVRAADGQTPLGVALSGGRRDLADWLDWRGWPLPRRALQPDDVPAAAIVGDCDGVRRLLDLGLPVDAADSQGCTALLRAAGGGHRDTLELLLARGADPQRAANTGATPLSAAVSMRQGAIVERLLGAGAALEQRLPGQVTVLMLGAALGLPDICARLLTAGADIQARDAQGLSPLHCAALFGFTTRDRPRLLALLDTLLLAGADPDARAAGDVTPLLLLLGARAEPGTACDEDVVLAGLDRLLDEDIALDARDPRGFGPLHLAALHGQLRMAQRLLRAGCDPDLRDALNRTPREIAVMRGFVDVAAEFAPLQAGVSMARFLREPR
ncbi:MAG TPA: ankyrin repeat domain-containing protein [Luteimonas sp.]|nr:ankyrin repeat domain-containing protein [Luteimonas sp.]